MWSLARYDAGADIQELDQDHHAGTGGGFGGFPPDIFNARAAVWTRCSCWRLCLCSLSDSDVELLVVDWLAVTLAHPRCVRQMFAGGGGRRGGGAGFGGGGFHFG